MAGQLYQMYFFERILERLSKSQYSSNIILKGGLLLSSIIGEDERTTKDMDTTLKSIPLSRKSIQKIFEQILSVEVNDNVTFEILNVNDIREEDEYGGFKVNIIGKMEKIKIHLAVEITTGDIITPREIEYNYDSIFENKKFPILAYTTETIIAEKYHSIITRGTINTRMKDFYDIYVLFSESVDAINSEVLRKAIINTFKHRKTEINILKIDETIEEIRNNENIKRLWTSYQSKAVYANKINFESLFNSLQLITSILQI